MRQNGFFTGLITGAIGAIAILGLSPATRRYMRPVFQVVIDQVMSANERLQRSVHRMQEDVEDLIEDVRHRSQSPGISNGEAHGEGSMHDPYRYDHREPVRLERDPSMGGH